MMTNRHRALGFICIALHAVVVYLAWKASLLTPRIINITECSL